MDKKVTSIVCYIGILGWLIALLAGDKEGAKFHMNQGLIVAIMCFIPIVNFVGWIFAIIGIVNACQEQEKELPLVGSLRLYK